MAIDAIKDPMAEQYSGEGISVRSLDSAVPGTAQKRQRREFDTLADERHAELVALLESKTNAIESLNDAIADMKAEVAGLVLGTDVVIEAVELGREELAMIRSELSEAEPPAKRFSSNSSRPRR